MNMMRLWMRAATEDERILLAFEAGTTRGYLDQLAGGHREPKPELAAQIEEVTYQMYQDTDGRLPRIYRTDLVSSCRSCEFAKHCLGDSVIVRSEFPVVEQPATLKRVAAKRR